MVKKVLILIEAGANLNTTDNLGYTALMRAIRRKKHEIAVILIKAGADLSIRGKDGNTALIWAARTNSLVVTKELVARGVDVDARADENYTALWWACRRQNSLIVRLLLENQADPCVYPKGDNPALHWAVKCSCLQIVRDLLRHEANSKVHVDKPTGGFRESCLGVKSGELLQLASRNGHSQIVEALLKHDFPPDGVCTPTTDNGNTMLTPLIVACRYNRDRVALKLLQFGANPNATDANIGSPLFCAVRHSNTALVRTLIRFGADPNQTLETDRRPFFTPFLRACVHGKIGVVKAILQVASASQITNGELHTAIVMLISLASQSSKALFSESRCQIMSLLLKHGGNVSASYNKAKTLKKVPLLSNLNPACLVLLIRSGLDNTYVTKLLLRAAIKDKNNLWMVSFILEAFPSFMRQSNEYNEICDEYGDLDIPHFGEIRLLMEVAMSVIPSLSLLCIERVRSEIFANHQGKSLLLLIKQLPDWVANMVGWQLSLDRLLPSIFTGRVTPKRRVMSDTTEAAEWNVEGDRDVINDVTKRAQPPVHQPLCTSTWYKPDDIESQVSKYFDIGLRLKDRYLAFRWILVELREVCSCSRSSQLSNDVHDVHVHDVRNVHGGDINSQLLAIDDILSTVERDKSTEALVTIVSQFLTAILRLLRKDHHLNFTLLPCGSVYVGNKVGPLDEIDFILRWNIPEKHVAREQDVWRSVFAYFNDGFTGVRPDDYKVSYSQNPHCPHLSTYSLRDLVYKYLKQYTKELRDTFRESHVLVEACYSYHKGPAMCLKLAWDCNHGNNQTLSVDMTPMLVLSDRCVTEMFVDIPEYHQEYCMPRPELESYDLLLEIMDQLRSSSLCLVCTDGEITVGDDGDITSNWMTSLSLYQWQLFQILDDISPNIRKLYRLLKIIRDLVLPKVLRVTQEGEINQGSFKVSSVVSSYALEHVVLHELFKTRNQFSLAAVRESVWTEQSLLSHLRSCLAVMLYEECVPVHWIGGSERIIDTHGLRGETRDRMMRLIIEDLDDISVSLFLSNDGFRYGNDDSSLLAIEDSLPARYALVIDLSGEDVEFYQVHKDFLVYDTESVKVKCSVPHLSNIYYYDVPEWDTWKRIIHIDYIKILRMQILNRQEKHQKLFKMSAYSDVETASEHSSDSADPLSIAGASSITSDLLEFERNLMTTPVVGDF